MTSALPHVAYVVPGLAPLTLHVRWQEGGEGVVDVSGLVSSFRVYAPLRDDSALFAQARVGEHGTDVAWTGEIRYGGRYAMAAGAGAVGGDPAGA